jgi:antibiotic biosynthesis monooxygenase (ABM) superfamily enzyme
VTVVRFATYTDLRRWEESTQFVEWLQRLEPLILEDSTAQEVTGMETWFTIPSHIVVVPPPKYKMAVLAILGASPFVLVLIPVLISLLGGILPPVVISLIILLIMSVSMTWVTMPLLARLARRWLYPVR